MFECFNPKREEICFCEVASSPCTTGFASQIEEQDCCALSCCVKLLFSCSCQQGRRNQDVLHSVQVRRSAFNNLTKMLVCMYAEFYFGQERGLVCAPLKISPLLQANTEIIQHKMYDFEEVVSVWNRKWGRLKN